jgi:hypothetical protein
VLGEAVEYTTLMLQLMDQRLDFSRLSYIGGYGAFLVAKLLMVCVIPRALRTITAIRRVDEGY